MKKRIIPVLMAVALMLCLCACGGGGKDNVLEAYDGVYSEEQLVVHMVKLLVEEHTDLKVNIKDQMTGVNAFKEMTAADPTADFLNGYDGTLLTTYLHLDPTDVPEGKSLYDYANEVAMERYGVRLLEKLGTDNTYAIAVPQALAEERGFKTISDLVPVADQLVFGAEHEFFSQEGSMKYGPFTKFYGLNFKNSKTVDIGLKYSAIENGNFDVTEVYATDGLNRKAKLVVLEDDLGFFPEYNGAVLVRDGIFEEFADAAPNLEEVLNMLAGQFTNETMTDLTYAVDVEGRSVDEVAKEFLVSKGLISE
ncbi:MAG: glycine/betaine ABC transporter substrate-binding protein [Clostridiales bacterium]|nr:glycine/betaine ABC transporter substrate-binding protein [Clostridiales bacterium]